MARGRRADRRGKRRKLKLLRLAAVGGLIAWIVKRKRGTPPPEGVWRDHTKSGT